MTTTTEPLLRGSQLSRSFGAGDLRTTALEGVSVEFHAGEVTLIMGPSGSGKSTLLAVLSGVLRPDAGRVTAFGEDLWSMSPRQQKQFRLRYYGFIFQQYNLFPALTARQQLEMIARWGQGATAKEARQRTDALLASLGLAKKGHLRPSELSGGEQQRVAVGRALIKSPRLCFADEPTGALDWAHGRQVVELLRQSAKDLQAALVIVAHDHRLTAYADRVIHLEDGRLCDAPAT